MSYATFHDDTEEEDAAFQALLMAALHSRRQPNRLMAPVYQPPASAPISPPLAPQAASTGQSIAEVLGVSGNALEVRYSDGSVGRITGNRPTRTNNPGSLNYGDFARRYGAIGTDGRLAVFPTPQVGRQAQEALLFNPEGSYAGMDITRAINRYAPSFENDTQEYINYLVRETGIPANTPLSAMNPLQRTSLLDAMNRMEGYQGDISALSIRN